MQRRTILKSLGASLLLPAYTVASAAPAAVFPAQRYRDAMIIDGQGGAGELIPQDILDLKQSGISAFSVTVNEVGNGTDSFDHTLRGIAEYGAFIAANPQALTLARTSSDIRQAKSDGKTAVIYNFQDTNVIGVQLDRLDMFRDMGIRIVQLTYNKRNLSGDGALEHANAGISDLGCETIDKINSLKLLLDLSHGGQQTTREAIAYCKRPMLISHTGCRALNDNPRNVGDAELKAMANKGGVMGIYFMPFLVEGGKPTRDDVIRHLEHAVKVCGEDHVSIGTDGNVPAVVIDDKAREQQRQFYEKRKAKGIAAPGEAADVFNLVMDYNDCKRFQLLADDLVRAGWPERRVEKILGTNLLRIYGEVWDA